MLLQHKQEQAQLMAENTLNHLQRTYTTLQNNKQQLSANAKEIQEFYQILRQFAEAYQFHHHVLQSYMMAVTLLITQYWQLLMSAGLLEKLVQDFRYNKPLLQMWINLPQEQLNQHSLKMHVWMLNQYLERELPIDKAIAFGFKLRAQIEASHAEFVELIKDQNLRSSLWMTTSACLNTEALMAFFAYEDIRNEVKTSKARIWAQGIFDRAPAIAAWLMEDQAARVWVEAKLTIEKLTWINQHYPEQMQQLLAYDSVVNTLLAHSREFLACAKQQPNIYLGLVRSKQIADVLAPVLLKRLVDLNDVSVLYTHEIQTTKSANAFYQRINTTCSATKVAQQIYDNWFYDRHNMTRELALAILKPLTNPAVNPDQTSRHRANFFCAELHMHNAEHQQARQHLMQLNGAKDALDAQEHEVVVKYHALVNKGQQDHRFFAATKSHRPHMEEFARTLHDDAFKDQLQSILQSLTKQLNKYLSQRETTGLMYSLGFKNRHLSEQKNQLVKVLSQDVADAQKALKEVTTAEEATAIAQKLANQLKYAENLNKSFYAKHARTIDGKGTLGSQLNSISNALQSLAVYQDEKAHSFR